METTKTTVLILNHFVLTFVAAVKLTLSSVTGTKSETVLHDVLVGHSMLKCLASVYI